MKRKRVIVELDVDDTITTDALKADLTFRLRTVMGDTEISYKKGTMPDPDTVRRGTIYYKHAIVLQPTGGRQPKPKVR